MRFSERKMRFSAVRTPWNRLYACALSNYVNHWKSALVGRRMMESGSIFLKKIVLLFIRSKSFILSRKSIDCETNKLEREVGWPHSDEQKHGRNTFGPLKSHTGNVTEQFCAMYDA